MKQLKKEESSVWHIKRASQKIKILNQKGQSLVEMLIAVAIGLIVSAAIATVFVFAMQQMSLLIERNEVEQNSLWVTYYLQKYLSQGINVQAMSVADFTGANLITIDAGHNTATCPVGTANPASSVGCGYGQFVYDFDAHNNLDGGPIAAAVPAINANGAYHTLAVFNREIGNPQGAQAGTPGSTIMPSGIFIREPMTGLDPNDTLIDNRSYVAAFNSTAGGGGPVVMLATNSALNFGRLHNLRVQIINNCTIGGAGATPGYNVEVVRDSDGALFTCIPLIGGLPQLTIDVPVTAGFAVAPTGEKFWVKTATFEATFRYFKDINRMTWDYFYDGGNYLPATPYGDPLPAPGTIPTFRDVTQTMKVNFNNNVLTTQSLTGGAGVPVRAGGPLYFFDTYIPMSQAFGY